MSSVVAQSHLPMVKRFYDAMHAGDMEKAGSMLHEDFVLDESRDLQYGGVYRGKAGLLELGSRLFAQLEGVSTAENVYLDAGDRVTVLLKARFTSRKTGKSLSTSMVEVATICDGLIAELDVYYKEPGAVASLEG